MYDARTNLSSDVSTEVRRHLGSAVYDTVIPRNVSLSEAPSHGLPIARYRPESRGAEAYLALSEEVRHRDGRAPVAVLPAVPLGGSITTAVGGAA
jgi:chromosome partitioning protein